MSNIAKLLAALLATKILYDALRGEGDEPVQNCHEDILAYHDEDVTLPEPERREMRARRDTNRRRLKDGLDQNNAPKPIGSRSQGSYAMRTMVQQPDKDYDIDDGIYFEKDDLDGPNGGAKTANEAREMVRQALDDGSFNRPPEKRKNCVRVYYEAGYHVDVPVYRRVTETSLLWGEVTRYELAGPDWKASDPLAVTNWFLEENKKQSPDTDNGGQLRRVVRLLKAFGQSRQSWRTRMPSGLTISKLVVEEFRGHGEREDWALRDTMVAIRDRLNRDLEVEHPTVEGEYLTKGPDDSRTEFLRAKLDWALEILDVLSDPECSREGALRAWDRVFDSTFFIERATAAAEQASKAAVTSATVLREGAEEAAKQRPVDKRGGGRFA